MPSALRVLTEKVGSIDQRVDSIDKRVDALSTSVDKRFDEVTKAFVEQRQYTEFVFKQLDDKMSAGFAQVTVRFAEMDKRMTAGFGQIGRLERKLDQSHERLERKLDQFIESQTRIPRRASGRRRSKP